ncbi:MAG TPA: DegT/DnrJ/EryC1/StrS aminotransferase family protein [Gemmatimonadaceae bacterium]
MKARIEIIHNRFEDARENDLPAVAGGTPVRKTNLPYGYHWVGEEEERELVDTLRNGWLTSGPKTAAFEDDLAQFTGSKYAVALSSASAALHLALLALDVGPGDEVITTPLTFVATANAILHVGAKPVFADIDPETLNIDPANVARLINRRTKVILPVHYAGQPCDMDVLRKLARKHRLRIVEDASHAIGATVGKQRVGSIGDLTCFSFHPVKNMTTAEGGMITTNLRHLVSRIRALRFHGLMEDYITRAKRVKFRYPRMRLLGFKYVMTDLQASLGIHQLRRVPEFTERRTALAALYQNALAGVPEVRCPVVRAGVGSAWHLYVIRLNLTRLRCSRDEFIDALKRENITGSVHYLPVHMHPYYAERFGLAKGDLPEVERAYREIVTLPLFPRMRDEDVQDVVAAVKRIIRYFRKTP